MGCDAKTGTCEVPQPNVAANVQGGEKCCEGKECCIENKMKMLMCAAHEAKRQVMIEIMKEKIKKAYGKKMEKMADAVMDAMKAKKESMVIKVKAKKAFQDELEAIFKE
ncbi:MAG: hypothetical protein HQL17_00950 [Candidatus Omnitrophica bacterium]|nr:hypothetical protein [Candidatus Omnitrophota bacterium]